MWIDLPSGAKADLLPPDKLKAKHTRAVTRAISEAGDQRIGAMVNDMTDGILAIVVQDWTCVDDDGEVLPIPSVKLASIDELDAFDYDAILNHDITTEVTKRYLKLRGERISPDDHADPASPTGPSSGSGPALRVESSPSTTTSGPNGTTPPATSLSLTAGEGHLIRSTNSMQGSTTG